MQDAGCVCSECLLLCDVCKQTAGALICVMEHLKDPGVCLQELLCVQTPPKLPAHHVMMHNAEECYDAYLIMYEQLHKLQTQVAFLQARDSGDVL